MNLYLISQTENKAYDTYDSAIVAAETAEEAQLIHPSGDLWTHTFYRAWASHQDYVTVKLIGTAVDGTKAGMILGSFNAG